MGASGEEEGGGDRASLADHSMLYGVVQWNLVGLVYLLVNLVSYSIKVS